MQRVGYDGSQFRWGGDGGRGGADGGAGARLGAHSDFERRGLPPPVLRIRAFTATKSPGATQAPMSLQSVAVRLVPNTHHGHGTEAER